MKRLLTATMIIFFMLAGSVLGAGGSNTYTLDPSISKDGRMVVVTWVWIADDETAVVPSSSLSVAHADLLKFFYVDMGETFPGSPAPTSGYNVTLEVPGGLDVFGGKMEGRSDSDPEQTLPSIDGALGSRPLHTGATLVVSGNEVISATGIVKITFLE